MTASGLKKKRYCLIVKRDKFKEKEDGGAPARNHKDWNTVCGILRILPYIRFLYLNFNGLFSIMLKSPLS